MSDEIERLLIRVEANATQFEAQMRKLNKSLHASQAETRKVLNGIQRDTEAASRRMFAPIGEGLKREIAGMAGSVAALFTTQQIVQYADDWTSARNALAAAGIATADLADRQQQLVDLANDTRTSTASTVELYARLTRATSELGLSQSDVLRLTELLNKSFASSGLSTQEAAAAALQLSQALASGQLQGDELRSLRENAPAVAQAIADAMGVGIGALKDLGAEGKLTASVVSSAILGAADDIETRFGSTTATVGQALTILNNQLGAYIGQGDQSVSATQQMAQAIIALANNLDTVIPVVMTLATAVAGAYAISLTTAAVRTSLATASSLAYQAALIRLQARQTGATSAQIALNAAMAANPIGLVVTVVAALAAGLFILATRYNTTAIAARELDRVVGAADTAMEDYRKAVEAAKNASADERAELRKKAQALREVTLARINDARVAAQRQIDEAVAARRRADRAIGDSADARSRALANPTNATAALAGGASSQARGAISLAVRAREEANTAIRAFERLKGAMEEIENPRSSSGAGGGGAGGGGSVGGSGARASAGAVSDQAREVEQLRSEVQQLSYDLLSDTEKAAVDLAKVRDTLRQAVAGEIVTQRAADILEAGYAAQGLDTGSSTDLQPLGNDARELGEALAEGFRSQQEAFDAQGRDMARNFVDVMRSDNIWEAAGYKFREAAFNGLEDLLSGLFSSLFKGGASDRGLFGSIASGLGSIFGGFRAGGGPVSASKAYVVGERGPELFRPSTSGSILSNGQLRGLEGGLPTLGAPAALHMSVDLTGANGEQAIAHAARTAAAEGARIAYAQAMRDSRRALPAALAQYQRLGTV